MITNFLTVLTRRMKKSNKKKQAGNISTQISRNSQTRNSAFSMEETNTGAGIAMDTAKPITTRRGSQYLNLFHMVRLMAKTERAGKDRFARFV